ncbi:unnamed protein product [Larinioides sclopetarius]|uniref:Uncharacterized protein n=1 Tax=Larinioides sclopetarius TaxID=280406 RepID=A0AAV2AEP4_9ARAC
MDETRTTLQQEINNASRKAYKTKKTPVTPNLVWWSQHLETKKNELKAFGRRIQRSPNEDKSKWIIQINFKWHLSKKNSLFQKETATKSTAHFPIQHSENHLKWHSGKHHLQLTSSQFPICHKQATQKKQTSKFSTNR